MLSAEVNSAAVNRVRGAAAITARIRSARSTAGTGAATDPIVPLMFLATS